MFLKQVFGCFDLMVQFKGHCLELGSIGLQLLSYFPALGICFSNGWKFLAVAATLCPMRESLRVDSFCSDAQDHWLYRFSCPSIDINRCAALHWKHLTECGIGIDQVIKSSLSLTSHTPSFSFWNNQKCLLCLRSCSYLWETPHALLALWGLKSEMSSEKGKEVWALRNISELDMKVFVPSLLFIQAFPLPAFIF